MRQPNMAYRGVPARGYPIGPDNRRRPGRTGFSPFSRSTRFPFTSTASPPAPLAIRKAPSASVESIQPRPPQPCEVGRPKGRRRKNRRQSHNFFLAPAAPGLAIRPEREYVVAHRPFLSFMDRPTVTSRPARLWREVLMALNTTTSRRDGVIVVYCSGAIVLGEE